jgi:hypothetical protein
MSKVTRAEVFNLVKKAEQQAAQFAGALGL